jgi:glycosyltransferase involved in cell wall biosynthesis
MKVAIQTFKNTGHSGRGVGVYGDELINGINELKDIEVVEFSSIDDLKTHKIDVVHFLTFDLFQKTLPSNLDIPFVVTVHDVTPLVFSKHYPAGIRGKVNLYFQKKALKKASRVITVSEASKRDITKYLGINENKIDVIYSGVSKEFKKINDKSKLEGVKNKYKLPSQFAFYSGNVNWNKNILNMTEAVLNAGLDLVIVGKSFSNRNNLDHSELKSFKAFLEKYDGNPKIHILGFVPTGEMVSILNAASVALFVSFYEGFGFPILEAQKCEVPVITSNTSSMPEVGGDGVLYVNPEDVDEITTAIVSVVNNNDIKKELIEKGLKNVERFSWEKCAKETVAVYRSVTS